MNSNLKIDWNDTEPEDTGRDKVGDAMKCGVEDFDKTDEIEGEKEEQKQSEERWRRDRANQNKDD